jgi:4'-phosphopantetheinyl transferase
MRSGFRFELSGSETHVWTLPTAASNLAASLLTDVLTTDEKDRASRFRFRRLRESFVSAHGALRYLLGRYLDCSPSDLRFVYRSKGKPALLSETGIQFNMAHSGCLIVIAVTLDRPIGVDIEEIRQLSDMQQIAYRFFCPEEAHEIMSLPETERHRGFFSCWTRKEAFVKATGHGLSVPLNSFRVTLHPDLPARFVQIGDGTIDAQSWMLHDLQLAPGYAAALAYHGRQQLLTVLPIDLTELFDTCSSRIAK